MDAILPKERTQRTIHSLKTIKITIPDGFWDEKGAYLFWYLKRITLLTQQPKTKIWAFSHYGNI